MNHFLLKYFLFLFCKDLEKRAGKETPFNFLLACKASIPGHWGVVIYNQIVTWTDFAILAMFLFLCCKDLEKKKHLISCWLAKPLSLSFSWIFFSLCCMDLEKMARKENPFNFLLACKASIRSDGPPLTHRSDRSPFTQLQLSKSSDFPF